MPLLRTSSSGNILTVHFTEGKILDALMIQNTQDELLEIVGRAKEPNILLDFRAVKFLSSSALGMLLRAQKKCRQMKADLKLCNIAPSIQEVFRITGLDKALAIYPDSEAAERAFAQKK